MLKFGLGLLAAVLVAVVIGCGAVHSTAQLGDQARALVAEADEQSASRLTPAIFQKARENLKKGDKALDNGEYDQAKHWYERAIVDAELTLANIQSQQ